MTKPKPSSKNKDMFVYSTLANDQKFNFFGDTTRGAVPQVRSAIRINGGAGVAHKKTLVTPLGAVTRITAEDYENLKNHPQFKAFEEQGVMFATDTSVDVEVAAVDLERDNSAPMTSEDFDATKDGAKLKEGDE